MYLGSTILCLLGVTYILFYMDDLDKYAKSWQYVICHMLFVKVMGNS